MTLVTNKRWAARLLAAPEVFDSIVAPFLFPGDYKRFWNRDEDDVKDLYRGVAASTGTPERLMSALGRRKGLSLTYGEIESSSVLAHVWPGLQPGLLGLASGQQGQGQQAPVFADLGSGTGKIPMQVYFLYTAESMLREAVGLAALPPITSLGVELGTERHSAGEAALAIAAACTAAALVPFVQAAIREGLEEELLVQPGAGGARSYGGQATVQAVAEVLASALRAMPAHVQLYGEDILRPELSAWPTRVTAVFVNNRVFEESLMSSLGRLLAESAGRVGAAGPLRALVLILPLCTRHRERCAATDSACAQFHAQAVLGYCNPSWCDSCSLWWYYPASRPHPGLTFPLPIPDSVHSHGTMVAAGAVDFLVPASLRSSASPSRGKAGGKGAGEGKQGAQQASGSASRASVLQVLPPSPSSARYIPIPGISSCTSSALRLSRLALGGEGGAGAASPSLPSLPTPSPAASSAQQARSMGPPSGVAAPLSPRSWGSSAASGPRGPLPPAPPAPSSSSSSSSMGQQEDKENGMHGGPAFHLLPPPTVRTEHRMRRSSSARSEALLTAAVSSPYLPALPFASGGGGARFMYQASPSMAVDGGAGTGSAPRGSPLALTRPSSSPMPGFSPRAPASRFPRSSTASTPRGGTGGAAGGGDGYTTPIHQMIRKPTEPPGAPRRPKAQARTGRGAAGSAAQGQGERERRMSISHFPMDDILQMNVDVEGNGACAAMAPLPSPMLMPSPARAGTGGRRRAQTAGTPQPLPLAPGEQGAVEGPVAVSRFLPTSPPRPFPVAPAAAVGAVAGGAGRKRGIQQLMATEEGDEPSPAASSPSLTGASSAGEGVALPVRTGGGQGAFVTPSRPGKRPKGVAGLGLGSALLAPAAGDGAAREESSTSTALLSPGAPSTSAAGPVSYHYLLVKGSASSEGAGAGAGAGRETVYGTPVKGGTGYEEENIRTMPTVVRGSSVAVLVPATPDSSVLSTPPPSAGVGLGLEGGRRASLRARGEAKLQQVQAHSQAAAASLGASPARS